MNHLFKQAVKIGETTFSLGLGGQPKVYDVPKEIVKHPHFKTYLKAGYIVSSDAPPASPQETPFERSQRLHKEFGQSNAGKKEDDEPADNEESFDDEKESDDDSEAESEGDFDFDAEDESEDSTTDQAFDDEALDGAPKKKAMRPKAKKKKKSKK